MIIWYVFTDRYDLNNPVEKLSVDTAIIHVFTDNLSKLITIRVNISAYSSIDQSISGVPSNIALDLVDVQKPKYTMLPQPGKQKRSEHFQDQASCQLSPHLIVLIKQSEASLVQEWIYPLLAKPPNTFQSLLRRYEWLPHEFCHECKASLHDRQTLEL